MALRVEQVKAKQSLPLPERISFCLRKPNLEDRFPHVTLVIVGLPGGWLVARHDSIRPDEGRIRQQERLELLEHLSNRVRTDEQIDDTTFDRMKTDGMIDLLAIL